MSDAAISFVKVTFIYALFIKVKTLIHIKNGFLSRDLAKREAEIATNMT